LEWHLALEDIELRSGRRIMTMIEPGMLGKICMNSPGVGVCLNILPANEKLTGLPVRILLRGLLECNTIDEAKGLIQAHGECEASHILIGDKQDSLSADLVPSQPWLQSTLQLVYAHTNHYFQPGQAKATDATCLHTRLRTLKGTIQENSILDIEMVRLLLDNSEQPYPVLRP
jgi:isopenicillin-N N-acyltransferase-like protein